MDRIPSDRFAINDLGQMSRSHVVTILFLQNDAITLAPSFVDGIPLYFIHNFSVKRASMSFTDLGHSDYNTPARNNFIALSLSLMAEFLHTSHTGSVSR